MSAVSIKDLAQKCWLPATSEESLSFLPKQLTPPKSRRLLICRDQLFKLFARPDAGKDLYAGNRNGRLAQAPAGILVGRTVLHHAAQEVHRRQGAAPHR